MVVKLKDQCAIVGVGETPYTRGTDKSTLQLHLEAAANALADAGLNGHEIDGFMPYSTSRVLSEQIVSNFGLADLKYCAEIRMGGATNVAAIESAVMAITCGIANVVLLTAGRRGYSEQRISAMGSKPTAMDLPHTVLINQFEVPYGNITPLQWYAAGARRHMNEYGTTSRQFGAIAVACRKHAMLNPKAVMRKPMTIEDHQNSRMVVAPMHLLDCSLETDGAGALVITSAERARSLKHRPIYIMGVGQGHPRFHSLSITNQPDITIQPGIELASQRAFAMAGVKTEDIDFAEIYDAFTWIALNSIESIGFCKKGEGGPFVENGRIELGGQLPINTHGGLLSEAHVSGVNHVIEAVRQLRGDCGERQVENAEIGLVSGEGDFGYGGVTILRR